MMGRALGGSGRRTFWRYYINQRYLKEFTTEMGVSQ
jgi:hypothetical protein